MTPSGVRLVVRTSSLRVTDPKKDKQMKARKIYDRGFGHRAIAGLVAVFAASDAVEYRFINKHCSCCGRGMKDSISCEVGIGPACRRRLGGFRKDGALDGPSVEPDWVSVRTLIFNYGGTDFDPSCMTCGDARKLGNALIHRFAHEYKTARWIPDAMYALGFQKVAERMAKRAHVLIGAVTPPPVADTVIVWDEPATVTETATVTEPATEDAEVIVVRETITDTYKGETVTREVFTVAAPYSETFNAQKVPGRWFDRTIKVWRVPVTAKRSLWDAIQTSFKGLTLAVGRGGPVQTI